MSGKRIKIVGFSLAAIFFVGDRFLKLLAVSHTSSPSNLVGDIFRFSFTGNKNIAFSIPISGLILNIVICLIILSLISYFVFLYKKQQWLDTVLLFGVILGSISNLWDRFKFGFVIDYFDLKYFTVFNIADVLIVAGAAWMVWESMRSEKIIDIDKKIL